MQTLQLWKNYILNVSRSLGGTDKSSLTNGLCVVAGQGQLIVGEPESVGHVVLEDHPHIANGLIQTGILQVLLIGEHIQAILHIYKTTSKKDCWNSCKHCNVLQHIKYLKKGKKAAFIRNICFYARSYL